MIPKNKKSDEELMEAYQLGDSNAFNELYGRYAGRVQAYVSQKVFRASDRDDLYQAIFLKLHKSRHLFSKDFQFAPWIFTICRTSLIDFLKANDKNFKTEELNEQTPSVNNQLEDLQALSALTHAMSGLPENQQKALKLKYEEGLDFKKIADRMKTSDVNVRKLISRGLKKLRGNL